MKLLVAQLKNQNPMQPTDSNAYMQQMAVFAQVEKLGQLVDSQAASQAAQQRLSAEALVGMRVTGTDATGAQQSGIVDSITLNSATPQLTLDDGSTVALTTLTKVERPSTPEPAGTTPHDRCARIAHRLLPGRLPLPPVEEPHHDAFVVRRRLRHASQPDDDGRRR